MKISRRYLRLEREIIAVRRKIAVAEEFGLVYQSDVYDLALLESKLVKARKYVPRWR